ncbi:carbohydrate ABC transporter permease [Streptomyces roseirectus]|uniref:Carbohydrate ABC transporter permease n=1 Tax=Streptomyces roseirectus TaxID=2768066 RepID=A0A7H0IPV9_9ACTN|nr:carbohydrate ABC transporter permease [Streptomyces roseirectus]QNP74825.1 carbohydrate ABC transporter permease [Streptomyces roseirectus]
MRPPKRRGRRLDALGLLVAAVLGFPVYWMVLTAFRPATDILSLPPEFWPSDPTLANFTRAMGTETFWANARSSAVIGLGTVAVSLLVGTLAAFALARFRFAGRKAFVVVILTVQMIPLAALVIPVYLLLNDAGLTDSLVGVIIVYLVFTLPFAVWMLQGFIAAIPVELEEAAMVDGCGRLGAFVRVVLPLLGPGLVATSVFAMVQAWNEYVLVYVLLSTPEKQTLSIWLVSFQTSFGTDYGGLMAGATLTALPVVVFFLAVHRKIAAGLAVGAVKG